MYRSTEDLAAHAERPVAQTAQSLIDICKTSELEAIESHLDTSVRNDFERVVLSPDPIRETVADHEFAPALMTEETGTREPPSTGGHIW